MSKKDPTLSGTYARLTKGRGPKVRGTLGQTPAAKVLESNPYPFPFWLTDEAVEFWGRAARYEFINRGFTVMTFGKPVTFTYPDKVFGDTQERTKEQLIWCGPLFADYVVEAFRYQPWDRDAYKSDLWYQAAMAFNKTMWWYVEKNKEAPSKALEQLKSALNRGLKEIFKAIATSPRAELLEMLGHWVQLGIEDLKAFAKKTKR